MSSDETLATVFEATCRSHARTIAVVTPDAEIDYATLGARARAFASDLAARGVRPGDRVALMLPNGVDWIVAHWGIARAGGVVVPISPRSRAPDVQHALTQSEAAAVVSADGVTMAAGAVRPELEDVHLLQLTSGSTGAPKAAMLTHASLLRVARSHAASSRLAPGEAIFVPNPFSHVMGIMLGVLVPVVAGATIVTAPKFSAEEAVALVERRRCVVVAGVPSHYLAMVEARADLSHVRVAMCGGAALTPDVMRRIVDGLGLRTLTNGLGMSEASGSVTRTPPDAPPEIAASSIGPPMPWLETRIVDPASGADVARGAPGELWIRGPGVMKGYFRMPEATAEVLTADGWLKTGDLVTAQGDGSLAFVGRKKEMFTVGGFNVYPAEIERALAEHAGVAESCVVEVADERLGGVPFAFVRARAGATLGEDDVVAFLRERIAGYKVPRFVEIVAEMPLTGSGKVDRRALRDRAAVTGRDRADRDPACSSSRR